MTICLHASADRQRSRRHGAPVLPYALHVANLFDGLMGFLQAPVSEATARALAAMGPGATADLLRAAKSSLDQRVRVLTLRMPEELLRRLDAYTARVQAAQPYLRLSRTDVIRMLLDKGLSLDVP